MPDSLRTVVEGPTSRLAPPHPLRPLFRGCLLAGAVGDALGAGIEFLGLSSIRSRFGPGGVTGYVEAWGGRGRITDDTQMTLFTAEGLIRAAVSRSTSGPSSDQSRGIGDPPAVVHHAYRRWLHTQGVPWKRAAGSLWSAEHSQPDGWLVAERWLHARRAPGNTCVSALSMRCELGTPAQNDSKGCGGVMRVAPVGLISHAGLSGDEISEEATSSAAIFRLGMEIAALTHGHPSGQLPAGVFAATIHEMVHGGRPLEPALDAATELLRARPHHGETLAALTAARALALRGDPTPEKLETLGGGWVAEEALAIAVYAALSHPRDLRAALLLAVNHSGDSDSTAAICGNLLGAALGESALPEEWLAELEGAEAIRQIADDLSAEDQDLRPSNGMKFSEAKDERGLVEGLGWEPGFDEWRGRYPGW